MVATPSVVEVTFNAPGDVVFTVVVSMVWLFTLKVTFAPVPLPEAFAVTTAVVKLPLLKFTTSLGTILILFAGWILPSLSTTIFPGTS